MHELSTPPTRTSLHARSAVFCHCSPSADNSSRAFVLNEEPALPYIARQNLGLCLARLLSWLAVGLNTDTPTLHRVNGTTLGAATALGIGCA